jgi:hypothetical protein
MFKYTTSENCQVGFCIKEGYAEIESLDFNPEPKPASQEEQATKGIFAL